MCSLTAFRQEAETSLEEAMGSIDILGRDPRGLRCSPQVLRA